MNVENGCSYDDPNTIIDEDLIEGEVIDSGDKQKKKTCEEEADEKYNKVVVKDVAVLGRRMNLFDF